MSCLPYAPRVIPSPEICIDLTERRRRAGLSLAALAKRCGVSRQSLTAVEAGRSVPSTALALRLARELGCRVEDLFSLAEPPLDGLRLPEHAGGRVVLGRVAERWVAHPIGADRGAAADGIVDPDGGVRTLRDPRELGDVALVAGCAPVLGVLAGQLARDRGGGATWIQASSGQALGWLAEGRVHLAGVHLAARDRPDEHDRLARVRLPGVDLGIASLVAWREGLAMAPGNPRGLRGPADLARAGLRVARRPPGSGAEAVLRRALASVGLWGVGGPSVLTHDAAAQSLLLGAADAAILPEPVAQAWGLPFVPLAEERFELVARARDAAHPGVQRVLEALCGSRFVREVGGMGAYDPSGAGAWRLVAA
jgi:putative molybdopterin biosynthesis protein